jgi:hypothetical protein
MTSYRFVPVALFLAPFLSAAPATAQYCGDYICDYGEESCLTDCGNSHCGDYICSPELGEDRYSCTTDCVCGDGVCSYGEDSNYCPGDCPPPPACIADTCTSCSRSSGDADGDFIPDDLEYDLAHAFFPAVIMKDVSTDLQEAYLYRGKAIPYTVQPYTVQGICNELLKCLEIRYGLAYRYDHGDSIASGHSGDSEFYAVLVMRTQPWSYALGYVGHWQMVRDFTAAHWGENWGVDSSVYGGYGYCPPVCAAWNNDEDGCQQHAATCGWYPGTCYGGTSADYQPCSSFSDEGSCYFAGGNCTWMKSRCFDREPVRCYLSQPLSTYTTLYASEKKHALYHSDPECDAGGFVWPWGEGEDECPNTNLKSLRDYKDGLLQNVGNLDYRPWDTTIQHPDWCNQYDVWSNKYFGDTTTPYYKHFTVPLKWGLVQ